MKFLLIVFQLLLCTLIANAKYFVLGGKVVDQKLQPISYVTVRIKDQDLGATSDAKGKYEFTLPNGKYELVYSMIGYEQQTAIIIIDNQNVTQNIILNKAKNTIAAIKVTNTRKDKSEEIVKNTIAVKESLQKTTGSFNVQLYIKALQESAPKTKTGWMARFDKEDTTAKDPVKDSIAKRNDMYAGMAFAEISCNLDFAYPNKIKEVREGVKKLGDISSLFYLSRTDGDFNFYNNLVTIPALSDMSFLSPISYSGLIAYKYKMLNIITKNNIKYYHIKVTPTKMGNALVEGEMTIMDSTWALVDFKFVFPKIHTPEYSFFQIEQNYIEPKENIWLPEKQIFTYKTIGRNKASGTTTVVYKNYNLDTIFAKKHFGMEVSSTAQEAYDKDSTFWNTQRTEPLSSKEIAYIQYKDSVYQTTHSTKYLDSIDAETNKITWQKIAIFGVTNFKRSNKRTISFNPLIGIWNPIFIGGNRFGQGLRYEKTLPNKKRIGGFAYGSYGVLNKDVIGAANIFGVYNAFNQGRFGVTIGSSFDFIFSGDAVINMISRNNIFKNNNIKLDHSIEIINGLVISNEFEASHRTSLSEYKTANRKLDTIDGRLNKPIAFDAYNALYFNTTISYTPQQSYIREPNQKIILGSKWPTFYIKWRKGLNGILGSVLNFDYIEMGLRKKVNAGTLGIGSISGYYGNFLNKNSIGLVDNKWVRRGDPFLFYNPESNFQSLDSTFAMFKGFAEAHYYHQFNGAIINKIPFVKRLNIVESGGGSLLYSKERNLFYGEIYIGLEKQMRVFGELFRLGGYFVSSYANTYSNPVQWKIGIRHYDVYRNKWE
jgi:Family of unknown function (DUF5686)/CarboxypepD_reg-like domain